MGSRCCCCMAWRPRATSGIWWLLCWPPIFPWLRWTNVVHADETGWRENGVNGYVWTFSTPTERYFLRRGKGKEVVDEALGEFFSGVLVSDFYAAYHHYDITTAPSSGAGPTCCGTSMTSKPSTQRMPHWPAGLGQSTTAMPRPQPLPIPTHGNDVSPN